MIDVLEAYSMRDSDIHAAMLASSRSSKMLDHWQLAELANDLQEAANTVGSILQELYLKSRMLLHERNDMRREISHTHSQIMLEGGEDCLPEWYYRTLGPRPMKSALLRRIRSLRSSVTRDKADARRVSKKIKQSEELNSRLRGLISDLQHVKWRSEESIH